MDVFVDFKGEMFWIACRRCCLWILEKLDIWYVTWLLKKKWEVDRGGTCNDWKSTTPISSNDCVNCFDLHLFAITIYRSNIFVQCYVSMKTYSIVYLTSGPRLNLLFCLNDLPDDVTRSLTVLFFSTDFSSSFSWNAIRTVWRMPETRGICDAFRYWLFTSFVRMWFHFWEKKTWEIMTWNTPRTFPCVICFFF